MGRETEGGHLNFAIATPPILPLLRGGVEDGGVILRKWNIPKQKSLVKHF